MIVHAHMLPYSTQIRELSATEINALMHARPRSRSRPTDKQNLSHVVVFTDTYPICTYLATAMAKRHRGVGRGSAESSQPQQSMDLSFPFA